MSAGTLSVHILPNGLNTKRLGLAVSSKAGCAVERNSSRGFSGNFSEITKIFPDTSDTVISARRPAEPAKNKDIEQTLRQASCPQTGEKPKMKMVKKTAPFNAVFIQRLISPFLRPCCRFYPSCADYSYQAIGIHGPLKGILISGWRVLRCHPFSQGGVDPVPAKDRGRGLRKIL